MQSFAGKIKNEIAMAHGKTKKCCAFSLVYGFLYNAKQEDGTIRIKTTNAENKKLIIDTLDFLFGEKEKYKIVKNGEILVNIDVLRYFTIAEYKKNVFKCAHCKENFLKAVFLLYATVNNPQKSYRLEFIFNEFQKADEFSELLSESGICGKKGLRNGKYIVYIKDSEMIEDFFAMIGANSISFEFMNSKILKDLRNNANRATNCDSANINKSLAASQKCINVIEELKKGGNLDLLPDQLKETAKLRMEYKELNYSDLALKFNPPISKSGLCHRLEKIVAFYENLKKGN